MITILTKERIMGMQYDIGYDIGQSVGTMLIDPAFSERKAVIDLAQHHYGVGMVTVGPNSIPVELAHLTWEQLKIAVGYTRYAEAQESHMKKRRAESSLAQLIRTEKLTLGRRRR
mgnify:CR=1 FL=1|jgi:hypothetical protein|tara:strand:- start:7720 stop:8064 length:345 start_codon:yes stop_codon:yes gene_type:complete